MGHSKNQKKSTKRLPQPNPLRMAVASGRAAERLELEGQLRELGFAVFGPVATAGEALALAASTELDVMFIDTALPGGRDGIWAAGELQKQHHIAVILITDRPGAAVIARMQEIAPCGYLEKPIQANVLGTAVLNALFLHFGDRGKPGASAPVVAVANSFVAGASGAAAETFQTCLCRGQGCSAAAYADRVFWLTLYHHAVPLALLVWPWRRFWFAPDYALIEQVSTFKPEMDLELELNRLRTAGWAGGIFRRFLWLRVSTRRLAELIQISFDPGLAA